MRKPAPAARETRDTLMLSRSSSHGTFDLEENTLDRSTAAFETANFEAYENRCIPSCVRVRCCGCFCLSWARRWETGLLPKGLRTADIAALERRQKALEWSNMLAMMDSGSSLPSSVKSVPDSAPSIHSADFDLLAEPVDAGANPRGGRGGSSCSRQSSFSSKAARGRESGVVAPLVMGAG